MIFSCVVARYVALVLIVLIGTYAVAILVGLSEGVLSITVQVADRRSMHRRNRRWSLVVPVVMVMVVVVLF